MSDYAKLRALAEKATQPGPWGVKSESQGKGRRSYRVIDANGFWVADADDAPHDAAYIAAASPDVVVALLDQLSALTAARDEACFLIQKLVDAQARYSPAAVAASSEFAAMKREIDRRIASLRKVGGTP